MYSLQYAVKYLSARQGPRNSVHSFIAMVAYDFLPPFDAVCRVYRQWDLSTWPEAGELFDRVHCDSSSSRGFRYVGRAWCLLHTHVGAAGLD